MKNSANLGLVLAVAAPLVVLACTATTAGTGGSSGSSGNSGTDGGAATDGGSGTDSGGPKTDGGGGGDGGGNCGATTKFEDCVVCCEDANPAAAEAWFNALGGCLCDNPGACKTACASSDCSTNPDAGAPDQACQTCEDTNGPGCLTAAKTKCGTTTCKAVLDCYAQAQCEQKP